MLPLFLLLIACVADPSDCASLDDTLARDLCWYDTATRGDAVAAERALAQVGDPVVRGAGVLTWVREHPAAGVSEVWPLCELMLGTERKACERRARSAHLRR